MAETTPPPGMDLRAIVAVSRNGVIGVDGGLPWKIPSDERYLRENVRGGAVIEGRRCYESRNGGFPGALRTVVVSSRRGWSPLGAERVSSLAEAYASLAGFERAVWIAGGEQLYRESFLHWRALYLTLIDSEVVGDTYFPDWCERYTRELMRREGVENGWSYSFLVLAPGR
ncbi:MAG: dihydrofolate reductase [Verrucomicrobiota bacterium]